MSDKQVFNKLNLMLKTKQTTRAETTINLANLQHNFNEIKKNFPTKKILAVIKNNAYGHGLIQCGKTLNSADFLGVADMKEAHTLRQHIQTPLVVMGGLWSDYEFFTATNENIFPIIYETTQLNDLLNSTYFPTTPIDIWIKIDTGMNRLGIPMSAAMHHLQQLNNHPLIKTITVVTHFANADKKHCTFMEQQIKSLINLKTQCKQLNKISYLSTANSSTLINYPEIAGDIIRPGLLLYGVSPIQFDTSTLPLHIKPVMTFNSHIITIKHIKPGESVGYGSRWVASKPTTIGIIALGYGDGYDRYAQDGTPVIVNDQKAFIAGRVSMNFTSIDITHLPNIKIGDTVTLWGDQLPIENLEQFNKSSAYDMLISAGSKSVSTFS